MKGELRCNHCNVSAEIEILNLGSEQSQQNGNMFHYFSLEGCPQEFLRHFVKTLEIITEAFEAKNVGIDRNYENRNINSHASLPIRLICKEIDYLEK
jgi:hypothetical protein